MIGGNHDPRDEVRRGAYWALNGLLLLATAVAVIESMLYFDVDLFN